MLKPFVILAVEIKARDTNFRVSQWKTLQQQRKRENKGKGRWIKCGKILLNIGAEYIFVSFQNKKWKKRKGKKEWWGSASRWCKPLCLKHEK